MCCVYSGFEEGRRVGFVESRQTVCTRDTHLIMNRGREGEGTKRGGRSKKTYSSGDSGVGPYGLCICTTSHTPAPHYTQQCGAARSPSSSPGRFLGIAGECVEWREWENSEWSRRECTAVWENEKEH